MKHSKIEREESRRLEGKAVSGTMLTLLLIGMLILAFNIQPVESEPRTWTVDDDGPANFRKIQAAINAASTGDTIYVKTGTYYEQVVVNKSVSLVGELTVKPTIIANGTHYTVYISANNVTLSGFEIQNSINGDWGIILNDSSNSIVSRNVIRAVFAILINGGSRNNIPDNIVAQHPDSCTFFGLELINSDNNAVNGNYLGEYCHSALYMQNSNHNYITFNYIAGHFSPFPFTLQQSNNNSIVGNTISGPGRWDFGGHMSLTQSSGNILYHNTFFTYWELPVTISVDNASMNTWDNGYPSGGNYWDDYNGTDLYSGPCQNETGSDEIGDTPYILNADNRDGYPLVNPGPPDIAVVNVTLLGTVVEQGDTVNINVSVRNQGGYTESFNVTAYANSEIVGVQSISLNSSSYAVITFIWNTTGFVKGDYTISGSATIVPGEADISDNSKAADDTVTILYLGHDIAVISVKPLKTVVGQGYCVVIEVTVKNYGVFTETFNVTTYANTTALPKQTASLTSGNNVKLTFTWNTTGFAKANYTISAVADSIPGEIDTEDNTRTCWVVVSIVGDVDGNGIVQGGDMIIVGNALFTRSGDAKWNPNADVDGNGIVQGGDMIKVGNHLFESWP